MNNLKRFFIYAVSLVIMTSKAEASWAQKVCGILQILQGGFMFASSMVTFIGKNVLNDFYPNHKEKIDSEFVPLLAFTSLYGVASLAIGIKTLYDTHEQEKNIAEKDIVTKLIQSIKKSKEEKTKK